MKAPVLLVGNFLSSASGSRCVCEELAIRLAQQGRRVLTVSRQRQRLQRLLDMVAMAIAQRREYEVAHVEVYSGLAFIWAEAVCATLRALGKPTVLTLHGGNLPAFARAHPSRVRRLLNMAQVVTAPSSYLQENLAPYGRAVQLLPNALEVGRYAFRLRDCPEPRLVWLRAFHRLYNPTLAVRVLAAVRKYFLEANLTMVGPNKGDGSYEETCRLAEELGLSHALRLPGQVSKTAVPAWLSGAEIFLNTTNVDNTPVSVLEALATGLCVVSTDVGGLPHLLEHNQTALLVKPDNPEAMAAAVKAVLTEPGLAKRLSENARAQARAYDWSVILPQWEGLLDQTAERCPRAARFGTSPAPTSDYKLEARAKGSLQLPCPPLQ